jgi:alpha,alpha-trehalase
VTPDDQTSHLEGGRPIPEVPSALGHWDEVAAAMADHQVALFLDFDGTLSPIVADPADAALLEGVRELVERLAAAVPVAIVSGRGADDVRARIGIDRLHVAGSHGFEIVAPDGSRRDHPEAAAVRPSLEAVADELRRALVDVPGVVVEPKRFGLTVHDRMVRDADVDLVRTATEAAAARHPDLVTTHGKRVTELRPAIDWDKGRAVRYLLDQLHGADVRPLYVGDDRTDEDAFAALGPEAVTVMVAPATDADRTTRARFRVEDPGEVRVLLERLVALLDPDPED